MSKISISVAVPVHDIKAVKLVRAVTGISVSSIEKRLGLGKSGVFYTAELFMNDHNRVAGDIRKLLLGLKEIGIEPFVMEISADEDWADVSDLDRVRVSDSVLLNVLNDAEGQFN